MTRRNDKNVGFTINIPLRLHRAAKLAARQDRRSLTQWILRTMERELEWDKLYSYDADGNRVRVTIPDKEGK